MLALVFSLILGVGPAPGGSSLRGPVPDTVAILLTPVDSSLYVPLSPVFSWSSVPGATGYLFQVATDSLFAELVFSDSSVADSVFRPPVVLWNDSTYYWRIAASDSLGSGEFTRASVFHTGSRPVLSADSLVFPQTAVGDSAVAFIRLANPMPVVVAVDSTVTATGGFVFLDGASFLLAPSETLVCTVLFRPGVFGRISDEIRLHTDQGPLVLHVRGDSPPPRLHCSRSRLDFGVVAVTDTQRLTLRLHNVGTVNRLVYRIRNRRYSPFVATPRTPGSLAAGDSATITVRFHVQSYLPDGYGLHYDTLMVESNGGMMAIPLRGDSPPPRPKLSITSLTYPEVGASDTVWSKVRLWNSSVNPLRVDSVRSRSRRFGGHVGARVVRVQDTTILSVRFAPERPGEFRDTLLLYNNSWHSPLTIALHGHCPYPLMELDWLSRDFGNVTVRTGESARLMLSNRSVSGLYVESISTKSRVFTVSGWRGARVLRYGDTLGITVQFSPDSLMHYADSLIILTNGQRRRTAVPLSGAGVSFSSAGSRVALPFELFQNFPNPFRDETTFRYALPAQANVQFEIYNTLGEHVETLYSGEQGEGYHNLTWSPQLPSGVYYYRLTAVPIGKPEEAVVSTRKMVIAR